MPIFKIADHYIKATPRFAYMQQQFAPYKVSQTPQNAKIANIDVSDNVFEQMCNSSRMKHLPPHTVEELVFTKNFAQYAMQTGGIVLHASAVVISGKAVLLSANTGGGKSTLAQNFVKAFGADKIKILNDDAPLLTQNGDEFVAHGTPFAGGSGVNINANAPLAAVVFVEKSLQNAMHSLAAKDALPMLLKAIPLSGTPAKDMAKTLELLEQLLQKTPVCRFECINDVSAAEYCAKELKL
jgi:hypothetical protein